MPMNNLIKYTDNDDPNDNLTYFESFKSKMKITGNTLADGNIKDVEIIVTLKYLSNFWRTWKCLN